jgi:predicted nucleic acid-binding protein
VITEAGWRLRAYPEAIRRLLESFRGRPFEIAPLGEADLPAIAAILGKYRSLGLQLADASLVHLANREGIHSMFTLDRRDFGIVRLARGQKLRLIP